MYTNNTGVAQGIDMVGCAQCMVTGYIGILCIWVGWLCPCMLVLSVWHSGMECWVNMSLCSGGGACCVFASPYMYSTTSLYPSFTQVTKVKLKEKQAAGIAEARSGRRGPV